VKSGAVTDSERFRVRAQECRDLANGARDEVSRRELNDIANELEAEADRLDAEGSNPTMPLPPLSNR
jgi:hypothetical protein